MNNTKLKWGETPFDDLTRDELLFEVRRMAFALAESRSVMLMCRVPGSPFFGPSGTGGHAIADAEVSLARYDAGGDKGREKVYRSFYRYASSLFFPRPDGPDGPTGWMVCTKCDNMVSDPIYGMPIGEPCRRCGTPRRPMTWDDLKPETPR